MCESLAPAKEMSLSLVTSASQDSCHALIHQAWWAAMQGAHFIQER